MLMTPSKDVPSVTASCARIVSGPILAVARTVVSTFACVMKEWGSVSVSNDEGPTTSDKIYIMGFNPVLYSERELRGHLCCAQCFVWLCNCGRAWRHFEMTGHRPMLVKTRGSLRMLKRWQLQREQGLPTTGRP